MEADGAGATATCLEHAAVTRLTCVKCRTPICPKCLVRTPVGMKCMTCGDKPGGLVEAEPVSRRRVSPLVPLVVAAVVALAIALPRLLSSGGESSPPDTEPIGIVADPSGPARRAMLGQEVRDGDLAFGVEEVECGLERLPLESGGVREAQGQYCAVKIDVVNTGRNPATFPARSQLLVDTAQRRFELDVFATIGYAANGGRDVLQPVINPGNQLEAVLVFDVPHDVRLAAVALRAGEGGPGAMLWLPRS